MANELDEMVASVKLFLGGFVIGALVGGVAVLLYAPAKGEDTRKMLKDRAIETEKMLEHTVSEVRDRAGAMVAEVREKAIETKTRGEEALRTLKE